MQHPMDAYRIFRCGKIHAVVPGTTAEELLSLPQQQAEALLQRPFFHIFRPDIKGLQQLKLNLGRQTGELPGTDFIENDLNHPASLGGQPPPASLGLQEVPALVSAVNPRTAASSDSGLSAHSLRGNSLRLKNA